MNTFAFDWQTADALTLRGKCWLPEGEAAPRALLCLVHGFGEYYGRYGHVAEFWTRQHIGLIAFDLRGHGTSDGKRGYAPSYDTLMEDIGTFLSLVREKFAGLPLLLYGHSMGGNLVLNFVLRYPADFLKGLLVTSPWLRLADEPAALKVVLGKLVVKLIPTFRDTAIVPVKGLSRNLEVGKAYLRDPMIHNKIGVKLYLGTTEAGEAALAQAEQLALPTLLMHGTDDPITSPAASALFTERANSALLTFRTWEAHRHELHNELEHEKVLAYMAQWVDARLSEA